MKSKYLILCEIGDKPTFSIGGQIYPVELDDIDKDDNLNRIYRIQFSQPPKDGQLERVISAIKRRPEIELRFYGNYPEDLIEWDKLKEIQNLQIDLWEIRDLQEVSKLTNLKRLGITKNVKSQVSLKILEPLQNLEVLYTSVSQDIETVGKLKRLRFLTLREIKHENLEFLKTLDNLRVLWLSLGSYSDFSGLSGIKNLQKLSVHQVRGVNTEALGQIFKDCQELWALKLVNLKHITNLDFVPNMPKLRYLSLEGIKNLDTFNLIKNSKTLETVTGYDCRPADKSLDGLKKLKEISLGDSYTKAEIYKLLKDNEAEKIWLRGNSLKGMERFENPFDIGEN